MKVDPCILNNRDAMIYVLWRAMNRRSGREVTLDEAQATVDEMLDVAPGIVAGAWKAWRNSRESGGSVPARGWRSSTGATAVNGVEPPLLNKSGGSPCSHETVHFVVKDGQGKATCVACGEDVPVPVEEE